MTRVTARSIGATEVLRSPRRGQPIGSALSSHGGPAPHTPLEIGWPGAPTPPRASTCQRTKKAPLMWSHRRPVLKANTHRADAGDSQLLTLLLASCINFSSALKSRRNSAPWEDIKESVPEANQQARLRVLGPFLRFLSFFPPQQFLSNNFFSLSSPLTLLEWRVRLPCTSAAAHVFVLCSTGCAL